MPGSVSKLTMLSGPSACVCVLVKPMVSWALSGMLSAPGTPAA
jgi:hypothetical protein